MKYNSENLILEKTTPDKLDFVTSLEREPENEKFICPSSKEWHLNSLSNPDIYHRIILEKEGMKPVGFVILAGMQSTHQVEFRRIVISKKGRGYGREIITGVKRSCFEDKGIHRLWLDVFDFNTRARGLYQSQGFVEEGVLREVVFKNGSFKDLIVMSILRSEYFNH